MSVRSGANLAAKLLLHAFTKWRSTTVHPDNCSVQWFASGLIPYKCCLPLVGDSKSLDGDRAMLLLCSLDSTLNTLLYPLPNLLRVLLYPAASSQAVDQRHSRVWKNTNRVRVPSSFPMLLELCMIACYRPRLLIV